MLSPGPASPGSLSKPKCSERAAALLSKPSSEIFQMYASKGETKVMEGPDLARLFTDLDVRLQGFLDEEFALADLKGDGFLTQDEFNVYHRAILVRLAGITCPLYCLFLEFIAFGGRPDLVMDNRALVHVCRNAGLIETADAPLDAKDVDIIFNQVKVKGERKISFDQFVYALALMGERAADRGGFDFIVQRVESIDRPSVNNGTKAEYVRWHDDASTITGIYKRGGPTNYDHVGDLSMLVDRRDASDVRGVNMRTRDYINAGRVASQRTEVHIDGEGEPSSDLHLQSSPNTARANRARELEQLAVQGATASTERLYGRGERSDGPNAKSSQGEMRMELTRTGDPEKDLRTVFEAYNIFDGGDAQAMTSRSFQKIFRDRDMLAGSGAPSTSKKLVLSTTYLDLLFTKMKRPGSRRLTFAEFVEALAVVVEEKFPTSPAQAWLDKLIEGGGPVAHGTVPDGVESDDDDDDGDDDEGSSQSTVVRRRGSSRSPSRSRSRSRSQSRTRGGGGGGGGSSREKERNVDPDVGVVRAYMPRSEGKWSETVSAVHAVFASYNLFGGKEDMENMEGRTWVKFCKEKGLIVKPLTTTDCDIIFAIVSKSITNDRTMDFWEFGLGLVKLIARARGKLPEFPKLLEKIAGSGGPASSGTVAYGSKR